MRLLATTPAKARRWLRVVEQAGFAVHHGGYLELTETGAFWLHLAQNYFALNYVNTLWTQAARSRGRRQWRSELRGGLDLSPWVEMRTGVSYAYGVDITRLHTASGFAAPQAVQESWRGQKAA